MTLETLDGGRGVGPPQFLRHRLGGRRGGGGGGGGIDKAEAQAPAEGVFELDRHPLPDGPADVPERGARRGGGPSERAVSAICQKVVSLPPATVSRPASSSWICGLRLRSRVETPSDPD